MTNLEEQKKRQGKEAEAVYGCRKCNGTGWLHGCQRWTPAKMKRGALRTILNAVIARGVA